MKQNYYCQAILFFLNCFSIRLVFSSPCHTTLLETQTLIYLFFPETVSIHFSFESSRKISLTDSWRLLSSVICCVSLFRTSWGLQEKFLFSWIWPQDVSTHYQVGPSVPLLNVEIHFSVSVSIFLLVQNFSTLRELGSILFSRVEKIKHPMAALSEWHSGGRAISLILFCSHDFSTYVRTEVIPN